MKKTALLAVALATCLGYVPAQAAEVVSSNIVGYEKLTIPANAMTIKGVQFKTVGDTQNDVVTLQSIKPEGYSEYGSDWIKVFDPLTREYMTAYYWGEASDGVYESLESEDPIGPGWGDVEQTVIDISLNHGQGFWTQSVAGGTLTVAGEVSATNSIVVPANAMTIVTSTYPGELDIQTIVPTGYSEYGSDWIKVFNPLTREYTTAYYWGEASDGVYESLESEDPIGPGWGDVEQTIIRATLNPGEGFWTQSVGGGKLTFPAAVTAE